MTERLLRVVSELDRIGRWLGAFAMAMIVLLILAMMYEVIARKVFNAPTMWAITSSYMFNGTLFLLGGAITLRLNGHVRIDFLSARLPVRVQHGINLVFYLIVFLPAFTLSSRYSAEKAWKAYVRGDYETMSAWEPLIWPFLLGIALGVIGLTLQVALETIRHGIGVVRPELVDSPADANRSW